MLKKIALAVMLVCGVAMAQQTTTLTPPSSQPVLEPGVVYSTGNLVNWSSPNTTAPTTSTTSHWINGVYTNTLCFYAGDPGNCGPNPTVRPGSINFSYGTTDIRQVTSIAAALPNSGTGLNVNGFNFGFSAKNGNGWDDGRQDYLMAYVRFYGPNGNTVANYDYNLNYKFDWTYFNLSKTFDTPYASKDLTAAQYGFIGRDNNYWAGNYGPEIQNVSFSLKYSVDPCATNPMFSPTCPGYLDALAKLVPASTTTTTTADPVATTTTSPTTIATEPVTAVVSTTSAGQPSVVASVVSAPAPTTTTATSSTSSSSSASSSSQTTRESSGSGGGNVSLALSIISRNSERDAAGAAVAQSAVAQAQAAANQAQQEASSVAASAVSNSLSANAVGGSSNQQSSGGGTRANNNNSTNFTLQSGVTTMATVTGPQATNNIMVQQQSSTSTGISVATGQQVATVNTGTQQSSYNTATSFALPLLPPQQQSSISAPIIASVQTEQQTQTQTLSKSNAISQNVETYSIIPPNFLTDKTNPLTDIIEAKQNVPQSNTTATTGPAVNRNAQDNDVAGGISINRMALAPTGYGDYLNFTLRDAAFYAPKEVYRNQRNVDNARALRQLTNDSKHKDMVEMQYVR